MSYTLAEKTLLTQSRKSKRGNRSGADKRKVFEGILWISRTGAPWADLPPRYPNPSTCWRRLKLWEQQGVWHNAGVLSQLNRTNVANGMGRKPCRGRFRPGQKGGKCVGKTQRGKGMRGLVVLASLRIPLG
ncbi:MAG: transposase, partial [Deltaproteobacteria bacterium]|nr:transposase [Deltaproteobacteria bacterium]